MLLRRQAAWAPRARRGAARWAQRGCAHGPLLLLLLLIFHSASRVALATIIEYLDATTAVVGDGSGLLAAMRNTSIERCFVRSNIQLNYTEWGDGVRAVEISRRFILDLVPPADTSEKLVIDLGGVPR